MIRAILFDLDGVLFSGDEVEFMRNYVGLLSPRFLQYIPSDRFVKQLFRSIDIMIKEPKPDRTNLQTFFDDFSKATGLTYNTLWPIFEEFYAVDFPALQCMSKPNPEGKKIVEFAIQQGYMVALVSNPVLPLGAVVERINWAELSPEQFAVISSIENFHYCKPHLGFFEEMAVKLNLDPTECLIVGNQIAEDIVVRELGLKTFLLDDSSGKAPTDDSGDFSDLYQLILKSNQ
ncbi:MAG: HAD family hydrolase [Desulfitobacteriaceae bacterium]|nr:HAD family hydrolase [Desulfitobacteriaceae bacterium]MDD4346223.1 HAD family hydrolase [Desulfitobacteriaceae bacterium]MDD4401644.1 HAD family hydrolase [Desulfitobacteriaceae bacterium]